MINIFNDEKTMIGLAAEEEERIHDENIEADIPEKQEHEHIVEESMEQATIISYLPEPRA